MMDAYLMALQHQRLIDPWQVNAVIKAYEKELAIAQAPHQRALINGKRRFVVYLFDLVDHPKSWPITTTCRDGRIGRDLKDMIKEGKFRDKHRPDVPTPNDMKLP